MVNPIRPTDDEARALARQLMKDARFAAIGVLSDGAPMVTRVAFGLDENGAPITLVSDLSAHTRALQSKPLCSLLVGEPGAKGDPLTHPRLTIQAQAGFVDHGTEEYKEMAAHYLRSHPKSKLYIDFTDFRFVRFEATAAHLNGGFGKAFVLTPADLGQARQA
ncbi:MAG: pyridoxamine 5'-phosphate oxidase family protein [Pseudomonadota bacterium]